MSGTDSTACETCGRPRGWDQNLTTCPVWMGSFDEWVNRHEHLARCYRLGYERERTARLAAEADREKLRKELEEARAEYAKAWDAAPDESLADLMRTAITEASMQRDRFKDRGAQLDAAEATAKAQAERLADWDRWSNDTLAKLAAACDALQKEEAIADSRGNEMLRLEAKLAEVERERDEARRVITECVNCTAIVDTRAKLAAAEAALADARALNSKAACIWCGHIGEKNSEAIAEHILACVKNPIGHFEHRANMAEAALAAVEQEASRLRTALVELRDALVGTGDLPDDEDVLDEQTMVERIDLALSPSAAQPAQEQLSKKERSHEAKGIEPPRHAGVGAGDESDRDTANTGSKGQGGQSDGNSAGHPGRIPQETAPQDVSDRGAPPALAQAFREGAEAMRERCAKAAEDSIRQWAVAVQTTDEDRRAGEYAAAAIRALPLPEKQPAEPTAAQPAATQELHHTYSCGEDGHSNTCQRLTDGTCQNIRAQPAALADTAQEGK